MSYGDDIMATGQALTESVRCGGKVHILDRKGRTRWSPLWEGLEWIARPAEPCAGVVINGVGCRPYLEYPFTREGGSRFSGWRARDHVGAIVLGEAELSWAQQTIIGLAGGFIFLEPELAPEANPNKQWGLENWQRLLSILSLEYELVQPLMPGRAALPGAVGVNTPSFRHAVALMARAAVSVLPEGGLHHAAAALGRPAVVLFGGVNSPEFTGYPAHVNLADEGPGSPCGAWVPCEHCANAWARLTPETVAAAVVQSIAQESLKEEERNGSNVCIR